MFNQSPQKIVTTNRLPFLIGLGALIVVFGVFMFKAQMAAQHKELPQDNPRQSIDVSPKAAENSWFNDDKFKNIKIMSSALAHEVSPQEIEKKFISRQDLDLKKQQLEDEYATELEIQKMEDQAKIDAAKMEIEASQAPLSIDIPSVPGTQKSNKGKQLGSDPISEGLNQISDMLKNSSKEDKAAGLAGLGAQLISDMNNQGSKQAFLQKPPDEDDYLDKHLTKPRSRYEVKSGSYISAALITGINSDLPGHVNAQVTENVYDTVTGNYLLIPQGAKLVGEYNSNLTFGQERVQVVWHRIIFPDGKSIDIENMQGSDQAGYTGFFDKVNNHYLRIYGSAVLLSLMGAGYDILNQNENQGQEVQTPRDIVAANLGQKLSDVAGQTLQKNMDVQPTLIIDPGYKFKVMVMKDMILENIQDVEGTLDHAE